MSDYIVLMRVSGSERGKARFENKRHALDYIANLLADAPQGTEIIVYAEDRKA